MGLSAFASTPPTRLEHPRRVLVLGATGRLGSAISQALAARGDAVVLVARDGERLESLRASIASLGGEALALPADLRASETPEELARALHQAGGVDDVVLASGSFPRTPLEALRREDFEQALTVHAIAPLLVVSALSGQLARRNGSVVALTDAGVTRPYTNHIAYITAKGALQTGLRALAVELAPDVRVNLLALGIVSDPEADLDPLRTHRLAARSPLGRFGTPAEVVHAVLALLDATWTTGEIWGIGR